MGFTAPLDSFCGNYYEMECQRPAAGHCYRRIDRDNRKAVMPEGTSLAATLTIAERIARDIRDLRGVDATLTSIGGASGGFGGITLGAANRASSAAD